VAVWRVAVVWECAIRAKSVAVLDAVQGFVVGGQRYIEMSEGKARGCLDIRSDILSKTQVGA
jgi:G:T-mismatch repair DNA endonuclease (very short patch repair protein)